MNKITLVAKSVRVQLPDALSKKKLPTGEQEMRRIINEYVTPHRVANSLLVMLGENPIDYFTRESLKPDNSLYNYIVSHPEAIQIPQERLFVNLEASSTNKVTGTDTGTYCKDWFDCAYFVNCKSRRRSYDRNIVDDFHKWLIDTFKESCDGSFASLMQDFESLAMDVIIKEGSLEQWVLGFLPSKFHVFNNMMLDSCYTTVSKAARLDNLAKGKPALPNKNGVLSKNVTRAFWYRDGKVQIATHYGNPVYSGAPRKVINADLQIDLLLTDDLFEKTIDEIDCGVGNPLFATLGDGGLCRLKNEKDEMEYAQP